MSSKIPMVDGATRRALCSQALAQENHRESRKAQGAGRGGFGLVRATLGVSGSKKQHTNVLGFSHHSVSNHSHTEQEQKETFGSMLTSGRAMCSA